MQTSSWRRQRKIIDELEEELDRKREIIDSRNREITQALEQKNYNAQRLTQYAAAGQEKDKTFSRRLSDCEWP